MKPLRSISGLIVAGLLATGVALPLMGGSTEAFSLPGPLYRLSSGPTVYVEHDGALHAVASPAMLYDLGYGWADVHVVNQLPASVGSPVQLLQPVNSNNVYLYQGGETHWIESGPIFNENGFQWGNVYHVTRLPASMGSPITGKIPANGLPASYATLSGFPYAAAGQTRSVTIEAFTSAGVPDTAYSGSVTVSNPTANLSLWNGQSYVSGPVSVTLTHGIGTLSVKAGTTPGQATLAYGPGSLHNSFTLRIMPNTTQQIGWRVFTTAMTPVTASHPDQAASEKLLVEPVDAAGKIVSGSMTDNVTVNIQSKSSNYQSYLQGQGSAAAATVYAGTSGASFTFTVPSGLYGSSNPITFAVVPDMAMRAQVTAVAPSSGTPLVPSKAVGGGSLQVVSGISAGQTYTIQVQLATADGNPISGLQSLNQIGNVYPTPTSTSTFNQLSISKSGRQQPSTLTFDKLGTNHVYLTYHAGSANNAPDAMTVFGGGSSGLPGTIQAPQPLQLITNAF